MLWFNADTDNFTEEIFHTILCISLSISKQIVQWERKVIRNIFLKPYLFKCPLWDLPLFCIHPSIKPYLVTCMPVYMLLYKHIKAKPDFYFKTFFLICGWEAEEGILRLLWSLHLPVSDGFIPSVPWESTFVSYFVLLVKTDKFYS